jgi:hypothetical protein
MKLINKKSNPNLDKKLEIPYYINISLPISSWEKKKYISSCWFWSLANWCKIMNINFSEEDIRNHFLNNVPIIFRNIVKKKRNYIWTTPYILKNGFWKFLNDIWKNNIVVKKIWVTIEDIIKSLQNWNAIMVLYTRRQKFVFETMKEKSELFNKYLWKHEKTFTYPYPHYALIVGLDGKNQKVAILDPNTWTIEKISFQLWREQFCLERKHQWALFHFAKKIWLMKAKTALYLEETN